MIQHNTITDFEIRTLSKIINNLRVVRYETP
jgi:hypothetical protein